MAVRVGQGKGGQGSGGAATRVHFVGIAGIGVSALARLALARGFQVSGSDLAATPLTAALAASGATVYQGHHRDHVGAADLVVISSAVRDDNPEVVEARHRGLAIIKRAEMLARVLEGRRTIAVAGTHGKTTTSALITVLLEGAGFDPLALVGGEMVDIGSNARLGQGDYAVAEADEYDASFLRLEPYIAVVTNVEPDHLDYYGDFAGVCAAFSAFLGRIAPAGLLVTNADDAVLQELALARGALPDAPRHVTYSLLGQGDWNATDVVVGQEATSFVARGSEGVERAISLRLSGRHNVANALAGIAVGVELGIPLATLAAALARFQGTRRRMEYKGGDPAGQIVVFDDYAHHPTEVRVNLAALRARFPGRRLRCLFQPHTYSRTRDLMDQFSGCFSDADEVVLTAIYAARETDTLGVSGEDLARAVGQHHPCVHYRPTLEEAAEYIEYTLAPGDVLVTMGAGTVWTAGEAVVQWLN